MSNEIDVSKCIYHSFEADSFEPICAIANGNAYCKDKPFCYYKRMKILEQKNEKLKKESADVKTEKFRLWRLIEDIKEVLEVYEE